MLLACSIFEICYLGQITVPIQAYRSNAMFKCDILHSIFRAAPWSSGRNAGKKSSGML